MHRALQQVLKENAFTYMYVFWIIRLKFAEIDFIYLVSPALVQVLNYMQREHEKNVFSFF